MVTKKLISGLAMVVMMIVASCGGGDTDEGDTTADAGGAESASDLTGSTGGDFDESSLPEDFPTELIPSSFDTGSYADLGATSTASFASGAPIDDTIAHYTDLLGEPTLEVEGDPGEKSANWNDGSWTVSVIGSPDESIIGISKLEG